MNIRDLVPEDTDAVEQCARLLVEGFAEHWPNAWPTIEDAREELRESFAERRIGRIAVGRDNEVLGWIGGIPIYSGNVIELHPLVVKSGSRGNGLGRTLLSDLEDIAKSRGAHTLWVGTDDEDGMTSLAHTDLYDNVAKRITEIRNLRGHPFEFYQRCGFTIVGVLPDANGPGKPDIFLAKRIE